MRRLRVSRRRCTARETVHSARAVARGASATGFPIGQAYSHRSGQHTLAGVGQNRPSRVQQGGATPI